MNNHSNEPIGAVTDTMLSDRLHTLAMEYSTSTEFLINLAVRRLIDDIDFMRDLRAGRVKME